MVEQFSYDSIYPIIEINEYIADHPIARPSQCLRFDLVVISRLPGLMATRNHSKKD